MGGVCVLGHGGAGSLSGILVFWRVRGEVDLVMLYGCF